VAFPGAEVLNITGPHEVFTFANMILQKKGVSQEAVYPITVMAEKPGPVSTLSGLQIIADQGFSQINKDYDTLLIPGGDPEVALANTQIVELIKDMAPKVRRLVSVCTGAFLLAESGLLDGRRATTHWNHCSEFAKKYPQIHLEPDRILIKEDNLFTSAGVTSGIDLALTMVEEDWGQKLALEVAQFLVVYLNRTNGQSQFRSSLTREPSKHSAIRDLQSWIMQNLEKDLRVDTLAERMAMSSRNFARLFLSETSMTPAKYVQMIRIEAARSSLELTEFPINTIADSSGFKDSENMRRSFIRQLGVNPKEYRKRFGNHGLDN
jgi:transcriptional regulator GlxA family with amidase domain